MALQPFIRRGTRSNATARRLVASSMQPAPSVLRSTVEDSDIHQPVMRCFALEDTVQAGVHIYAGQHFYLVASAKFPGRFYVLVHAGKNWKCSSCDETVRQRSIRQVEAYRVGLRQKQAA
jgi:hypothetical protein